MKRSISTGDGNDTISVESGSFLKATAGDGTIAMGDGDNSVTISGDLDVSITGGSWQPVKGGEACEVPPDSKFTMKVKTLSDYCCSFLD